MLDSTRLKAELTHIHRALTTFVATPRGSGLVDDLRAAVAGTNAAVVWQALWADCLRVVQTAVAADGEVSDDEVEGIYEMVFSVAHHYSVMLPAKYGEYAAIDEGSLRTFLERYGTDVGPFGQKAPRRWPGLQLCRRAAERGEDEALERYERMMMWLIGAACQVGGVTETDPRWRGRIGDLTDLRRELASVVETIAAPPIDGREQAFITGKRVFTAVQQASSVFEVDPFDVESVHTEARRTFEQMVERATIPSQHGERGRMLLVLGDSGAGKTHLLRAFRRHVHEYGRGFVAYAQLQSNSDDYGRYLLQHVVDSLAKPYAGPAGERTGLQELAAGLPRLVARLDSRIQGISSSETDTNVAGEVNAIVDELLREQDLASFDPDLLRVLLYALRRDSRVSSRVYKYLRCEDMTSHDRAWIGDVIPRTDGDHPLRMIKALARLAFVTQEAALVLMVDQAELAGFDEASAVAFRRAIDALYKITSEVPSAVAVVACLGDLYTQVRDKLIRSAIDRLEKDPPVERLVINRSYPEIEAIVAKRLAWLYADSNTVHRADSPVFPIPEAQLRTLANRRSRDVLEWCHRYQEDCTAAGRILGDEAGFANEPVAKDTPPRTPEPEVSPDVVAAAWNDARHGRGLDVPDEDERILELIRLAARACGEETGLTIDAPASREGVLQTSVSNGIERAKIAIAVTNKGPQRGAFGNQIEKLRTAAGSATPVAVRTTPFPTGAASSKSLAELLKQNGGRKELLDEGTLRTIVAYERFQPAVPAEQVAAWRRRDRPISSLAPMAHILDLARMLTPTAKPVELPPPPPPSRPTPPPFAIPPEPPKAAWDRATIAIGAASGFRAEAKTIELKAMLRHTGILGTTGSGKTTLALHILEQVLERDVAVVLVDRKGDLAGYARSEWWRSTSDPERARRIADRLDVRLFTPGTRGGRPLSLAVIPDLAGLPEHDRQREVQHAANALAGMMRFGEGSTDTARRAILVQAITVLAQRQAPAGLEHLIRMLEDRDDELIARAGRYDDKLFKRLVQDLETVRLNDGDLFDPNAEPLAAETLIGRGADGRTPLAITSTRFLGEVERIQSWVAHLVGCLNRYAVRTPSSELRLVLMLDEADVFMPQGSAKPPSKEPLQDLLRRSRTSGLGVVLASQSPADFDYRTRDLVNTWFLGKIQEKRAIEKMKGLFEHRPSVGGKLGTLEPGRFVMLQDGGVLDFERTPSLLRTDQLSEEELMSLARARRSS